MHRTGSCEGGGHSGHGRGQEEAAPRDQGQSGPKGGATERPQLLCPAVLQYTRCRGGCRDCDPAQYNANGRPVSPTRLRFPSNGRTNLRPPLPCRPVLHHPAAVTVPPRICLVITARARHRLPGHSGPSAGRLSSRANTWLIRMGRVHRRVRAGGAKPQCSSRFLVKSSTSKDARCLRFLLASQVPGHWSDETVFLSDVPSTPYEQKKQILRCHGFRPGGSGFCMSLEMVETATAGSGGATLTGRAPHRLGLPRGSATATRHFPPSQRGGIRQPRSHPRGGAAILTKSGQ